MSHSEGAPDDDRPSLALRIWRIVVIAVLILSLLLVLAYCVTQVGDEKAGGPQTLTPSGTTVTGTGRAEPTSAPATGRTTDAGHSTSSALKRTSSAGRTAAPGTSPGTTTTDAAGSAAGPSPTRSPVASESARPRSTTALAVPRAGPSTGGGSTEPDLRLVLIGSLLLASSIALGLFTNRRWRRAW